MTKIDNNTIALGFIILIVFGLLLCMLSWIAGVGKGTTLVQEQMINKGLAQWVIGPQSGETKLIYWNKETSDWRQPNKGQKN